MKPFYQDAIEIGFWLSFSASVGLILFAAFRLGMIGSALTYIMGN